MDPSRSHRDPLFPICVFFFVWHQYNFIFIGPPSPGSTYSSSSSQVSRNGAPGSAVSYSSPQNQSAFSAYLNYMTPSSASYANQMTRVRGPSQMPSIFKKKK
jgi:hypothetical protein